MPLHLGPLHPVEQWLTLILAFGPFLVLALVIVVRRRQDLAEEEAERESADRSSDSPPPLPR